MLRPTRVALALGSGGARGYAHIGVIEVLEERGFEVVSVAGSSMGALVGGLHAAGRLGEYASWVRGLAPREVLRLLDPTFTAPGALRGERIMNRVRGLVGDRLIEDLPIPFTAVATDLLARREVWFQEGPLDQAIRASIAIPTLLTPVVRNGRLLADGGLMNPVPVAPTIAADADVTVAVDLAGDRSGATDAPARESSAERPLEEWVDRFRRGAAQVLDNDMVRTLTGIIGAGRGDPAAPEEAVEEERQGLRRLEVMNLSIDAMQAVLTRYRMAGYPPDLLITVPKDACRSLDFHRAVDMIELGRTLTVLALDDADLSGTAE